MDTTTGFVNLAGADQDDGIANVGRLAGDEPLRATGSRAADNANRPQFIHLLGNGQQLGNRAKRHSAKIHVEARTNDTLALISQDIAHIDDSGIKELHLIDGDDIGGGVQVLQQLRAIVDRECMLLQPIVRSDGFVRVAEINSGFEDLDFLPGDLCPAQTADEFLSFTAEHAAANDFNPSTARVLTHTKLLVMDLSTILSKKPSLAERKTGEEETFVENRKMKRGRNISCLVYAAMRK
jgi:hypothetical protein